MPTYKCYSCMKTFDSDIVFATVADGGQCPRCFTLITAHANQIAPPPPQPPFLAQLDALRARARLRANFRNWCEAQMAGIHESGGSAFALQFEVAMDRALSRLPASAGPQCLQALRVTKIEASSLRQATHLLVLRFYDGGAQGLLAPKDHDYQASDSTMADKGQSISASSAHQSGHRKGSHFVSTTGCLPALMTTTCGNVRVIMYGVPEPFRSKNIKLASKVAQAPSIGVFLVPCSCLVVDYSNASESAHLAMSENEVLFDTRKGVLGDYHLCTMENPYWQSEKYAVPHSKWQAK